MPAMLSADGGGSVRVCAMLQAPSAPCRVAPYLRAAPRSPRYKRMSDFTFLHAADLHLDSPLRGLDADAPGERIRVASRAALTRLVDLALQRQGRSLF
jgi:hypothetical protein